MGLGRHAVLVRSPKMGKNIDDDPRGDAKGRQDITVVRGSTLGWQSSYRYRGSATPDRNKKERLK